MEYTSTRIINGKPRKVIVDDNGNIINKNPSKEEIKGLKEDLYKRQCKIKRVGQSYSKDQLLEYLKNYYEDNGKIPSAKDFYKNSDYPSFSTYQKHFGSWNNAVELALEKKKKRSSYTDDELLGYLRQFYEDNKRNPTEYDFRNGCKYPSDGTYRRFFGSWNNALILAGLHINSFTNTTDEELLSYLKKFYEDVGKAPVENDFKKNPEYPGYGIYLKRFGSFQNALKLVGLDVDTMARKGITENNKQKGRLFEIYVLEHFGNLAKDLSGENQLSSCDGICPKGHIYEVKSSKLHHNRYYQFNTRNKFREEIEYYYFGGFNSDWTKLDFSWRLPGELVDKDHFIVGLNNEYKYNLENMKEFDITDHFKEVKFLNNGKLWSHHIQHF